ncbi:MAG: 2-oxoacid:acceptor oxidoreductase family protein [Candidatus Bipolaricaulota bacterium]|nr:2-oxoacid:acceptor oxidoreductase family protein [Candidatus Bipolaricaulota bacterium]
MRAELRIAGFGGQGVISAGRIAGQAAVLYDGKQATFTQSYGPEARGGACAAEVVISDTPVAYPLLTIPDVAILMSQEAYEKYAHEVKPGGLLIVDPDLVRHEARADVRLLRVPATRIAESLGRKIVANVVMLGALAAAWPVVSKEALLQAVLASVPAHTRDLNQRAFEAGYNYVKEHYGAGS